jgi:hypothetical protein
LVHVANRDGRCTLVDHAIKINRTPNNQLFHVNLCAAAAAGWVGEVIAVVELDGPPGAGDALTAATVDVGVVDNVPVVVAVFVKVFGFLVVFGCAVVVVVLVENFSDPLLRGLCRVRLLM